MNAQMASIMGTAPFTTEYGDTTVTDYVGNKIYENGQLKRILIDGGYIEDGKYYFYLTDHLGNNRAVVDEDGNVVQQNDYYPFGMAFADSENEDVQPYKYNGKELDRKHGLNLYDYHARQLESAIGRFTSVDPLAEKYYSISPYVYCANNPLVNIDLRGDSITHIGSATDLQAVDAVHNRNLGGYYTVSTNTTTGLTTMTPVAGTNPSTMTVEQRNYYSALDNIVNGAGMTTINVVNNDNSVLIGDITIGTVDIGDINQIGDGINVSAGGTLLHETQEQYEVQVLGTANLRAHINATRTEGRATGNVYNPERPINAPISETGTVTVPVRNAVTGTWHNVMIHYTNGNVTSVIR